ncbi:MAG: M16 family metallopeptidase [Campylobacterota bacterium]
MSAELKHIKVKGIEVPVIFEKQTSIPTLDVQLVFRNSGYIQDKNKSGLANLSSKLLNEGTKKLGSTKFAQKLEESAISLSAANGFETFVIELSNLKDVTTKAMTLLSDLLQSPNYSDEVLTKLKTIQIGTLKRKESDYDYTAKNLLKATLFENTPLQSPSSGTIETIDKITLDDIKEFIGNAVVLNKLIVVAGGDFEFDEFKKTIKPVLEVLKKSEYEQVSKIEVETKPKEEVVLKDTKQAYIYFGSPFNIDAKDESVYMSKVASFILGGSGFGSRMMEEIRVKRGLAYSAYSNVSISKSHSYFSGYLQTKNESANEAKELVKSIINEFVKQGVTKEELESAKKFLTGSEPLRSETLSQRLSRAFNFYYKGLGLDYSTKELEKIQNLKLEDLNKFINSHNEIENLTFAIVRK